MTVRSYISSALRLLGVLAPGEPLQEHDYTDALQTLSDMLDAWSAEKLTIYGQARSEYALVNGTQRYTLGSGGTWNGPRPVGADWIDKACSLDANGIEREIDVFSEAKWATIALKSDSQALPLGIYPNFTYPLAAVDVWPVPSDATVKVVLYGPSVALASVSSLDTVISAPPGWAKALRYNLAVEFAPTYPGTLTSEVAEIAKASKAVIKRPNTSPAEMSIDPALLRGGRGRWSVETGEFI